jgi:hypothetical protein
MWHEGDNNVRARIRPVGADTVRAESQGLIEVRARLLRLVASSPKVAAVLASDEHNYSRILVTAEVPVGDPARDDPDGDGRICGETGPCSPLPDLANPVWYVVSGGAGAPYYLGDVTPWNRHWSGEGARGCPEPAGCFVFSPLQHWVLFEAGLEGIALEVYDISGRLMDRVPDLMRVKAAARRERRG